MESKNKLDISREALNILMLLDSDLLLPFKKLVDFKTAREIIKTNTYKNTYIPFPFIMTPPKTEENENTINNAKIGDTLELYYQKEKVGQLILESVDKIEPRERLKQIYRYVDENSHLGVKQTLKNIGNYAISGDFTLTDSTYKNIKDDIQKFSEGKHIERSAALVINANVLNRGLEYIITNIMKNNDLVVILLQYEYYQKDILKFDIRYKTLKYFLNNYTRGNKVIVIPMKTPYIYAGYNKLTLDMLITQNLGIDKLYVGKKHAGLDLYYSNDYKYESFIKELKNINIIVELIDTVCYCIECNSIISTSDCPHASHKHIIYSSNHIYKLLSLGIMPPNIIVRKEISSYILSILFKNRFGKEIKNIYNNLLPHNSPIIEDIDDQKFYLTFYDVYKL